MERSEYKIFDRPWISTEPKKVSDNIKIMYSRLQEDEQWGVHLIIGEKATSRELRSAWFEIEQERDKLIKFQGNDPDTFSIAVTNYLEGEKEFESYQTLSMEMNFYALACFLWSRIEGVEQSSRDEAITLLKVLLSTFQIKDTDVSAWLDKAKIHLKDTGMPWTLREGPITPRRVIDTLRQYKSKQKKQKIVLGSSMNQGLIFTYISRLMRYGGWTTAKIELMSRAKDDYEAFKDRLSILEHDAYIGIEEFRKDGKIDPKRLSSK